MVAKMKLDNEEVAILKIFATHYPFSYDEIHDNYLILNRSYDKLKMAMSFATIFNKSLIHITRIK